MEYIIVIKCLYSNVYSSIRVIRISISIISNYHWCSLRISYSSSQFETYQGVSTNNYPIVLKDNQNLSTPYFWFPLIQIALSPFPPTFDKAAFLVLQFSPCPSPMWYLSLYMFGSWHRYLLAVQVWIHYITMPFNPIT